MSTLSKNNCIIKNRRPKRGSFQSAMLWCVWIFWSRVPSLQGRSRSWHRTKFGTPRWVWSRLPKGNYIVCVLAHRHHAADSSPYLEANKSRASTSKIIGFPSTSLELYNMLSRFARKLVFYTYPFDLTRDTTFLLWFSPPRTEQLYRDMCR